jgi:hypothetical protein
MKTKMETSIGQVSLELTGHFLHLSTETNDYPEILVNLWNHEKREVSVVGGIKELLQIAIETLEGTFSDFEFYGHH